MTHSQAVEITGLLQGILIAVLVIMVFVIFHVVFQTFRARSRP